MKVALAQLNYHIGNFDRNKSLIKDSIRQAKEAGANLIVFAELAICGYPPRDFLDYDYFIKKCEASVKEIAKEASGITVIVGSPTRNTGTKGKRLFNSAMILSDGDIAVVRSKSLLPDYDIFDEYRYFEPETMRSVVELHGYRVALTICEDIWDIEEQPIYVQSPMQELGKQKPDLMINMAASPFSYTQPLVRRDILKSNAIKHGVASMVVHHVGAQTELIFDGGTMAVDEKGNEIVSMPAFEEGIIYIDVSGKPGQIKLSAVNGNVQPVAKKEAMICGALQLGIRDYFHKLGFSKAVLGLSGGMDSALVLVLAARALGSENIIAVGMPSEFSSTHSITDSEELCKNLGITFTQIPINSIYDQLLETLQPSFAGKPFDVTEENIQARIRALLLMAISNKHGYILLNTSNKSELAVGYGTLYGDMIGGLSVLGDVYKTEVYALANHINSETPVIPKNIIEKAPSAELRKDQKDSDSLPEYPVLDKILKEYIEHARIDSESDPETVAKVLNLVNRSEYKRFQSPPILRVSTKAFGSGRRMPIAAKYEVR